MKAGEFREFLKGEGLKFTSEREAVLDEVLSRNGHFDPEELYLELKKKGRKVSRASVYRTLPLLAECGLIEEVEKVDKHAHYERTHGRRHHDHMLCEKCGKIIEFYSEAIEKLQDELCAVQGFAGTSHTLEIRGTCRKCSAMRK